MAGSPLSRFPGVRQHLGGRMASILGRQVFSVAVGWDIYERTRSPLALGLVGLVQVVPVVLLALPAGKLVDRLDARRVAFVSALAMSAVGLSFAALSRGAPPVALLYALLFAHACAIAFHSPSVSSILPRLVDGSARMEANAWSSTAFQLSSVAGPALCGLLLASGSATLAYSQHGLGSAVFAAVLLWLRRRGLARPPEGAPPAKVRGLDDLTVGLRFIFRSKLLLPALTLDLFAVLLGGVTALLPIFAREVLQAGPTGLGLLRAAPAAGALGMALVTTRLKPWRHPGTVLLLVVAVFGLATLAFGLSRSLPLSLAALALAGAADNVSVVIRITLEQTVVPDALRGRVSAVHYVFISLSNELGEFESGLTAALLGPVGSVLLGGFGTLAVVGLVSWAFPQLVHLKPLSQLGPEKA